MPKDKGMLLLDTDLSDTVALGYWCVVVAAAVVVVVAALVVVVAAAPGIGQLVATFLDVHLSSLRIPNFLSLRHQFVVVVAAVVSVAAAVVVVVVVDGMG